MKKEFHMYVMYFALMIAGTIAVYGDTYAPKERDDTLAGMDKNNNGVRDDIDKYIDAHYTNPIKHAAVIQSAKVIQKALLVDKNNIDAIKKIDREDNRAVNCLFSIFEPSKIPTEIESLTINTKMRILEYSKYNKALDGTVSSELEEDSCEYKNNMPLK